MRIDEFFQQHSLKLLAIGRRAEEQDATEASSDAGGREHVEDLA
jgi:hypothetical protein